MVAIEKIINSFPEPFKTITKFETFNFDYCLNENQNDHKFLEQQGYELFMCSDCAFHVRGLGYINATSYGNWGSVYKSSWEKNEIDGVKKSFYVFCQMYEAGIVKLWRAYFSLNKIRYSYDDSTKTWRKCENNTWSSCSNPLQ